MKFLRNFLQLQTKVLIKNSSWVFAGNAFRVFLVFLKGVIMVRLLGAELYGLYVIIIAFVGLIQEFLNLNLGTTIIKFGASYKSGKRHHLLIALIKSGVLVSLASALVSVLVIVIVLIYFYDAFLETPDLEWYIITYAFAASTMFIDNISQGILRLFYRFKALSALMVVIAIVDIAVITVALLFESSKLSTLFIAIIASKIIGGIILSWGTIVQVKKELADSVSSSIFTLKEEWREITSFTLSNSGSRTIHTLVSKGDVLLLGALLGAVGPTAVTFYSIAKKLGYAVLIVIDPLVNSIYPQFSNLVSEKNYIEIRKLVIQITRMAILPSAVFLCVVYFLGEWLISMVFGVEFVEAGEAFFFHVISAISGTIFFWNLSLILSLGLTKIRIIVSAIGALSGALVAYWLIPKFFVLGFAQAGAANTHWLIPQYFASGAAHAATGAAIALLVSNAVMIFTFSIVTYYKINRLADAQSAEMSIPLL